MNVDPIEILAAVFGLVGTTLLALRGKRAGWGFVAFLASNAGWLVFAYGAGHWFLFAQQIGFTITSLIGIWQWLIKPPTPWQEAGETFPAGDLRTFYLAEQLRVIELERLLEEQSA
jgi:nicotinamide riboside transporter PnuC